MTMLAQYDRARAALAEATRVEEVLPLLDELEHVKLYAKQIRDKALLADASVFQLRAERRLGILLAAAKEAGQLAEKGRRRTATADDGAVLPATLEEIGVDRKLSASAQKLAALSDRDFESGVEATRERVISGRAKIIDDAPIAGARAVMAGRVEAEDSLDYFPTPPWATRALFEHVIPAIAEPLPMDSAWEPACGEGHIAEVLREYVGIVHASDIHDYGYAAARGDFLKADAASAPVVDWIVTNPPFDDAAIEFVLRARELAPNVAMFFRSQWAVEGIGRYERLFRDAAPTLCAFFVERVPLVKGRWDPDASTATAYCWLLWCNDIPPRPTFWIPPGCREGLTKPDDVERFTAHPVRSQVREEEAT